MIPKVPMQCNVGDISLNRIPQNLKNNLTNLNFLKAFFSGLSWEGVFKGYYRGSFYPE